MTAPRRQHGRSVFELQKSCLNKRRFANEPTARAGAQIECDQGSAKHDAMWIYPCKTCRGWHITNKPQANRWKVTSEELYCSASDEVRQETRDLFKKLVP